MQTTEGLINQTTTLEDYLVSDFTAIDGTYKIDGSLGWSYNSGTSDFIADVSLYNSSDLLISPILNVQQEPKDTGAAGEVLDIISGGVITGSIDSGTDNRHSNSFCRSFNLTSGDYRVIIKFAGSANNGRATVYKANINVELKN